MSSYDVCNSLVVLDQRDKRKECRVDYYELCSCMDANAVVLLKLDCKVWDCELDARSRFTIPGENAVLNASEISEHLWH